MIESYKPEDEKDFIEMIDKVFTYITIGSLLIAGLIGASLIYLVI